MRQRLSLYIDGRKADLSDDSLILFTYAAEDSDNPSVVMNSYTRTVTLEGTPANDIIFDHIGRSTHAVRAGAFSPIVRTPFAIYGETEELIESGYLKLDRIITEGRARRYEVTLYGGLGGLLYAFMYDSSGRERTLADMDYYESVQVVDADFDFPITAKMVHDAWQWLCRNVTDPSDLGNNRWKVINFAPMYNGIPGDFDANKALVTYRQIDGLASGDAILTTFAEAVDEWQMKDLRSYLQRPVLNVQAVLDTIEEEALTLGYTLNISAPFRQLFANVWMTLPRLSTLIKNENTGGRIVIPAASVQMQVGISTATIQTYTPSLGSGTHREDVTVNVNTSFGGSFSSGATYYLETPSSVGQTTLLYQLVAYGAGNVPVAASEIVSVTRYQLNTSDIIAAAGGSLFASFVDPQANAGRNINVNIYASTNQTASLQSSVGLSVTAYDAVAFRVLVQRFDRAGGGTYNDRIYASNGTAVQVRAMFSSNGADNWQSSGLRTGAPVTKQVLLGSTMSPAAFLLGLVRMYGAKIHYDSVTRTMSVMSRDAYYSGITDLTGRVDRSQAVDAQPYVFTHRFYRWALDGIGKGAEEYEGKYGRPYGSMTVDTRFPFDNETENVLDGVPFRTAADALHRDVTFYLVAHGGNDIPSPFLLGGAKYRDGNTEADVPTVTADYQLTAVNTSWPGYDYYPKVELEDDGRKGVDAFVLIKFQGRATGTAYGVGARYIRLTDDTPAMLAANGGKPCWLYGISSGYVVTDASTYENGKAPLPLFGRMTGAWASGIWKADGTLDFAVPAELEIPEADVSALTGLYADVWRAFVADRYDVDSRVVTARVWWRGIRVDASALRRFYAFDGALWVCVKIADYSLTDERPTECTFVKVQDRAAYINGQTY